MTFMKKQSIGFYVSVLTVLSSIIGTALYFGNCKTSYFQNLGVDGAVVGCLIAAIVCEAIFLCGNELLGDKMVLDILPVAGSALLVIGTVLFASSRVNGLAAIMTFNNNASTMADLKNTFVAFGFCGVAIVLSIVTSFCKIVKE